METPQFTKDELIVIRDALREWRTVAPAHVAESPARLERWRGYRELFDDVRTTAEAKATRALSEY